MERLELDRRSWVSDVKMLNGVDDEEFAERVESLLGKLEDERGRSGEK